MPFIFIFFKDFIYLFLERGEEKEKDRERNIHVLLPLECPLLGTWPATQACALTGNGTGDPLVCRLVLHPLSHTSQGPMTISEVGSESRSDARCGNVTRIIKIWFHMVYKKIKFRNCTEC